jgi:hypothetical protein
VPEHQFGLRPAEPSSPSQMLESCHSSVKHSGCIKCKGSATPLASPCKNRGNQRTLTLPATTNNLLLLLYLTNKRKRPRALSPPPLVAERGLAPLSLLHGRLTTRAPCSSTPPFPMAYCRALLEGLKSAPPRRLQRGAIASSSTTTSARPAPPGDSSSLGAKALDSCRAGGWIYT